jgi:hypothetical protein
MIRPRPALLLWAALLLCGCPETDWNTRRTVERYLDAVQASDIVTLARYSAEYEDAARGLEGPAAQEVYERFAEGVRARLQDYEQAKRSGWLQPAPDGIALARGLGLARGAFYQIRRVEAEDGRARLRLEVNLGYDQVPFGQFPPGTRVYLMGLPVGRLLSRVRGEGVGDSVEVLGRLEIDCLLERAPAPDHPTGWLVRSFRVAPGSERASRVTWR